MPVSHSLWLGLVLSFCLLTPYSAKADPLAAPGDLRLRHDLQLLNDAGIISVPLTAWPLPLGDVHVAVSNAITTDMSDAQRAAFARVHEHLDWELEDGTLRFRVGLSGAAKPRAIRSSNN